MVINPKLYNVCWTINKLMPEFSLSSKIKKGPNFLLVFFSFFTLISLIKFLEIEFGFSSNLILSISKSELVLSLNTSSSTIISSYESNILFSCLHLGSSNSFLINESNK